MLTILCLRNHKAAEIAQQPVNFPVVMLLNDCESNRLGIEAFSQPGQMVRSKVNCQVNREKHWRGRELAFVKLWPGISALPILYPLILTILSSKYYYSLLSPHFTFERMETQKCQVTFLRAHS